MIIAVAYDNGLIAEHFDQTAYFKIYETEGPEVAGSVLVPTAAGPHVNITKVLVDCQVNMLICGEIGKGSMACCSENGIVVFGGNRGKADDAVKQFLTGDLSYDPDPSSVRRGEPA